MGQWSLHPGAMGDYQAHLTSLSADVGQICQEAMTVLTSVLTEENFRGNFAAVSQQAFGGINKALSAVGDTINDHGQVVDGVTHETIGTDMACANAVGACQI